MKFPEKTELNKFKKYGYPKVKSPQFLNILNIDYQEFQDEESSEDEYCERNLGWDFLSNYFNKNKKKSSKKTSEAISNGKYKIDSSLKKFPKSKSWKNNKIGV